MCVFLTDPPLPLDSFGCHKSKSGNDYRIGLQLCPVGGEGGETKAKQYLFICWGYPATYMYVTIIIIIVLAKLNKERNKMNLQL